MIPLVWMTQSRSERQRVEWRLQALGGGGARELLFNEYRRSVLQDEKSAEIIGGDGCTAE